jgi:hypothetical protein
MLINATCVLQMIHFGLAYVMLVHILLKPGARMVIAEDKELQEHKNRLSNLEKQLEAQQMAAIQQWRFYKERLYEQQPIPENRPVRPTCYVGVRVRLQEHGPSFQSVKTLAHEIVKRIIA